MILERKDESCLWNKILVKTKKKKKEKKKSLYSEELLFSQNLGEEQKKGLRGLKNCFSPKILVKPEKKRCSRAVELF